MTKVTTAYYPDGYMDRVGSRGRIVSWAPQQKVLAHPSVACFMSHCGWNSTLEGVTNGVPFLCWPYFSDQFHNATYVCDIWRTGLGLEKDEEGIITRGEIKSKVERLLGDETYKVKALDIKEKMPLIGLTLCEREFVLAGGYNASFESINVNTHKAGHVYVTKR
ncbi:hypothetical protein L1987_71706 [Smallanthus sonchifolius]|uniref:Uncharacterized protein n=1 Tax=Smallanthus sonchifolius TaxID=185202 RepID=A0ACB9AST2_9ASTR|nr:hypothetical protein L1987_71706 [Smallanthus sonchifolius]